MTHASENGANEEITVVKIATNCDMFWLELEKFLKNNTTINTTTGVS